MPAPDTLVFPGGVLKALEDFAHVDGSLVLLVFPGGALKALDDSGRVGGYLVLFGGPDATDASPERDFFTPETDFRLGNIKASPILYHHTLDRKIGDRELGSATLKVDETGVWMEGQLALRDAYEKRIFGMVKAGKLGLSSGTAEHLVRKEKQANGSHKITCWPLGFDASLTPSPAEPRTMVVALKSLAAPEPIKLMAEGDDESGGATADADADGAAAKCAMKAGDCVRWGAYGGMKAGRGVVVSLHDAGNVPGTENHVEATGDAPAAKVHLREKLPTGGHRDTGRHQAHPLSKLRPDAAATKALDESDPVGPHAGLTLDSHSESVLAAVKGLFERVESLAKLRAAEGRTLSRARLDATKALIDALTTLHAGASKATTPADPPPSPSPEIDTARLRLAASALAIEAGLAGYLD